MNVINLRIAEIGAVSSVTFLAQRSDIKEFSLTLWCLYHIIKLQGGGELARKHWQIIFYEKSDGTSPLYNFIETLTPKLSAKIYRDIGILQEYGNANLAPYSKHLVDGIFELRTKQGNNITRILYFFYIGNLIVLTNGFLKKTAKTPAKELLLAKAYRLDFLTKKEGKTNVDL